MKYSGIGGQAVIEGIMMMKGEDYAVAVRRPDKEIEVKKDTYQSITKKAKILQLPFVRGVFRFADSMIIGMRSLTYSASFFEDDEDAEPGKFEQFLDRVFGEKLESAIMAAVLVISFILAIGIFMLLPLGIANLFKGVITSDHLIAVLEGVIRIAIFIIYIKLVSRMEDIRRTFMYHGAEHKTIFCYEHGEELTVDCLMCAVCNGRTYGGGFYAAPEAQPDDGWLDVFIIRRVSRLTIARLLGMYKSGRHFRNGELTEQAKPYFIYRRAKCVSLRPADGRGPIVATADGECAPCDAITAQLKPLAGRVLLPKPAYERFMAQRANV